MADARNNASAVFDVQQTVKSMVLDFDNKLKSLNIQSLLTDVNDVASLCSVFNLFKNEVLKGLDTITTAMQSVNDQLDDLEAYSRKGCLLLHGMAEEKDENVCNKVVEFINKQIKIDNFHLDESMIDNVHRLGASKKDKPRPIIIKFTRYMIKKIIFKHKRQLKNSGYSLTESLTKNRMSLYRKARERFADSFVWTNDGKILIMFPNKKREVVTTFAQLDAISGTTVEARDENKSGYNTRHAKVAPKGKGKGNTS